MSGWGGGVGGGVGDDVVGEGKPLRGAAWRGVDGRNGAKPGGGGEPAVGPGLVVDFPDAGVGFGPAPGDGARGGFGGLPVVGVEPVVAGGRGEQ